MDQLIQGEKRSVCVLINESVLFYVTGAVPLLHYTTSYNPLLKRWIHAIFLLDVTTVCVLERRRRV